MSLPPKYDPSDWTAEIGRAAAELMNATAKWYKSTAGVATLQFTSAARIQWLGVSLDASTTTEWGTRRRGHAQVPLTAHTALIGKGWIGQFSGGDDPALDNISVSVQSAINGSHAAVRTILFISELAETPRVPAGP